MTTAAHTKCSCSADFKLPDFKQASATPSAISMPETKGAEGRGSMRRERHEQHRVRERQSGSQGRQAVATRSGAERSWGGEGTSRSKRAAAQCISVAFDAVFPHSFSAFRFFVLQRERENEQEERQEEERKIKSRKYFCNF